MSYVDVIAAIEQVAPLQIAAAWDKSGVQVAGRKDVVRHLAVCLDPTPEAVTAALAAGADMVLSHHPLSLNPYFADQDDRLHEVLRLLLCADVPLYAAHTSLDANPDGPVNWFARDLGMEQCRVLEPTGVMPDTDRMAGFGVVGDVRHPLHLQHALQLLGTPARLIGTFPHVLRRVAVCPGSGGSLMQAAAKAGAQLFITGDIRYHDALEAPLPVLDVGHFVLEETMMRRFATLLGLALPDLRVTFLPSKSPFRLCLAEGTNLDM